MVDLSRRYPRKTVRVDVAVLRRKAFAIMERARHDRIVILRCGTPKWTLFHAAYYDLIVRAAGEVQAKSPRHSVQRRSDNGRNRRLAVMQR